MWVFGYGSLMWGGWETQHGCTRRASAELTGYRRVFNKASIRNWGTRSKPCPTLNLSKTDNEACRGVAFAFPDDRGGDVLAYLKEREGRDFALREMLVRLDDGSEISAVVPFYEGNNKLVGKSAAETASLIRSAEGRDGLCLSYVKNIVEKLAELGIDDQAVSEVWRAVSAPGNCCD
jgi:cation transport protein ChaC